jgi:hypothetical protein
MAPNGIAVPSGSSGRLIPPLLRSRLRGRASHVPVHGHGRRCGRDLPTPPLHVSVSPIAARRGC